MLNDDITFEEIDPEMVVILPNNIKVDIRTILRHYHHSGKLENPFTRVSLPCDILERISCEVIKFNTGRSVTQISTVAEIGETILTLLKHSHIEGQNIIECLLQYDVLTSETSECIIYKSLYDNNLTDEIGSCEAIYKLNLVLFTSPLDKRKADKMIKYIFAKNLKIGL